MGELFTDKTTEELFKERDKRVADAIAMRIPDRVPVLVSFGYFPAKYMGLTCKDAWYDHDKWLEATKKTVVDFAPDGLWTIQGFSPGAPLEILDPKTVKWPGQGVSPNYGHQAIEAENIKADEYDYYFNTNMPINYAQPENIKAMIDFTEEYGVYK